MKQLSRGDLIRTLSAVSTQQHKPIAKALSFDYQQAIAPKAEQFALKKDKQTSQPQLTQATLYTAKRSSRYWAVMACTPHQQNEQPLPQWPSINTQPFSKNKPFTAFAMPQRINPGQWQNLWDVLLKTRKPSPQPHLKRAVTHLSQARPLSGLPRRDSSALSQHVVLILDMKPSLRPAWDVQQQLLASITALLGTDQIEVYQNQTSNSFSWSRQGQQHKQKQNPLLNSADDAQVIIMSDFGALNSGHCNAQWALLLQSLAPRCTLSLLPLCPLQTPSTLALSIHQLEPKISQQTAQHSLEQLLIALSQTWLVSLAQLRALSLAIPNTNLHTELLLYNHPAIEKDDLYLRLREEQLEPRLQQFKQLKFAQQKNILTRIKSWDDCQGRGALAAQSLQQQLLNEPNPTDSCFDYLHDQAQQTLNEVNSGQATSMGFNQLYHMLPLFRHLARNASSGWQNTIQAANQVALKAGNQRLPKGAAGLTSGKASQHLSQHAEHLLLSNKPQGLLALGNQAYCMQTGQVMRDGLTGNAKRYNIIDRNINWQLQALGKPTWAQAMWRNNTGLYARHEDGTEFKLIEANEQQAEAKWQLSQNLWPWANDAGVDKYGVWAEVALTDDAKKQNTVPFKLRWIAAGSFKMGSPEDEEGRYDDETLHKVTLSQGYWLAETACTQALWLAVMENNPSSFNVNEQNPVEEVSWDDCQQFVTTLNTKIGHGFKCALPTEAQWEYACRAGTTTAFSFGDKSSLNNTMANYSGKWEDYDSNGKTTAVDAYTPNNWGLYQMHGNVWEWCEDLRGDYGSDDVTDPIGSKGNGRVLRGGSWIDNGRDVRSADRDAGSPDDRSSFVGLRLAGGLGPQASKSLHALSTDGLERSAKPRGDHGLQAEEK